MKAGNDYIFSQESNDVSALEEISLWMDEPVCK